jgi:hypothetical protein
VAAALCAANFLLALFILTESRQPTSEPVAQRPHLVVAFDDPPRDREDQREREVRGRLGEHAGRIRDHDSQLACGVDVEIDREDDGRWLAEITELPGVMAYADSKDAVIRRQLPVVCQRVDGNVAPLCFAHRRDLGDILILLDPEAEIAPVPFALPAVKILISPSTSKQR